MSGLIDETTAPKAKKRKTEQPEEAEDDGEVDGKDLEDDEADAGEEDADEDVSSCLAILHGCLGQRGRERVLTLISGCRHCEDRWPCGCCQSGQGQRRAQGGQSQRS